MLEFLGGGVLVAHNAPFDAGFLRAACERHGAAWPRPPVLCTARLARAVLTRDEAPSVKLGALAELFGTATRPTHRALADARATVEVLHHLLERIGNLGVQSLEELLALVRDATPHRPTQASAASGHLAGSVPSAPGVYLFRGARDEVLYVGTSGDLRRRVRSYFTAGERRRRIRGHGRPGRAGRHRRVRARAGGRGARAAADRRAPAPLQPPVAQPGPRPGG